ncbi:hypothetical protein Glove_87g117 [Diversispora epigaea]|uniref:PAZ domain-containing protein n=1 Tax=Diversispora epigaea TaxID=1348612 RepID=A0A397JEY8_9GLOM|nr:hypothetical protein Glove_87g117 [Diversispora epigaea]
MTTTKSGKSFGEIVRLIAKRPVKNEYKEVEVIANFLEVTKFQYPKVKSYTVDVITDRRAKASRKDFTAAILELLKDTRFGPAAYNGQLLYSVADLTHGSNARKFDVTVEPQDGAGRAKRLRVIIKFSYNYTLEEMSNYLKRNTNQTRDASIQNIFTILNAFLNTKVRTEYQTVGKKAIFPQPRLQDRIYLFGGVELIRGFYQSFRPGWDKLLVNVDVCATTYYPTGNFIDIIPRILYTARYKRLKTRDELRSGLTALEIAAIAKFLQDRDFTITYAARNQKKKLKLSGITSESADKKKFILDNGEQMTVGQYYRNSGSPLEFPGLPCAIVKRPRKDDAYYPLEICVVSSGQRYYIDRLSTDQNRDMNEKTAVKPKDRFAIIENAINNMYKHQEDQNLRAIGMGISNKFIKLKCNKSVIKLFEII